MSADAELRKFEQHLGKIASKAYPEIDKILEVGAIKIKNALNTNFRKSKHFKGAAGSVTYDSAYQLGTARYVIGPDKERRGGALGNIAFFGTSRGGGTVELEQPLQEEAPIMEKHLLDVVRKWQAQA